MHKTALTAASLAGALACVLSAAQAGTLIPVPQVPGSQYTTVSSINSNNVITGYYADQNYHEHGFVGTLDGQYTFFDYGNGPITQGLYINDNNLVTGWAEKGGAKARERQFARAPDGTITLLTFNGRRLRGSGRPGSITDNDHLAGQVEKERRDGTFARPRSYTGQGTVYTDEIVLPFRHVYGVYASGVNNNGTVVGHYTNCSYCSGTHGFVIENGVATQVDYPDYSVTATELYAINDSDLVVGKAVYNDGDGYTTFLYNTQTNRFKQLHVEDARGISNTGLVAVQQSDGPYIYCLSTTNCPTSAGAIAVADRWISATPQNVHKVLCSHRCRRPVSTEQ